MDRRNEYEPMVNELENCRSRIRELESKVSDLRMSRRVLMSLLEQAQTSRQTELDRLYRENTRLQRQVSAYARQLWIRNGQLAERRGGNSREEEPAARDR